MSYLCATLSENYVLPGQKWWYWLSIVIIGLTRTIITVPTLTCVPNITMASFQGNPPILSYSQTPNFMYINSKNFLSKLEKFRNFFYKKLHLWFWQLNCGNNCSCANSLYHLQVIIGGPNIGGIRISTYGYLWVSLRLNATLAEAFVHGFMGYLLKIP